jgi:hypothetical protein
MKVPGLTLVAAVVMFTPAPSHSQHPARSPLVVAFLYDLTMSAGSLGKPVTEIRQLQDVTECVTAHLETPDTLRFGFITSHLYLSRAYAVSEITDFYRKVVRPTAVAPSNRVGPSPIWDAIDGTISLLAADSGRRAVIVMTDGLSTGNVHGVSDVINHAKTAGVSISGVFSGNPFVLWQEWPVHPEVTLAEMAAATGGLYVVPKGQYYREIRQTSPVSKKNLNNAVELIFENLRR